MERKLVAPDVDRLLNCFGRGWKNPSAPTRAELGALDRLFEVLADLESVAGNSEAKSIWLRVPRGSLADFDDYKGLLDCGEVSSHEEYVALWEQEYPDNCAWYELTTVENERCRAVTVGNVCVACADLEREPVDSNWLEEYLLALLDLLTQAACVSMDALRTGTYNATVAAQLPYFHRFGIVRRKDLWAMDPASRKAIFEGMDDETFAAFRGYVAVGAEDKRAIGRLSAMTGNDFLAACALGYEACGYDLRDEDGSRLPLDELYLRYADRRDEGLTGKGAGLHAGDGIDLASPESWDQWYFDRTRRGGHPWEVCRGGNSTHVDLAVCHDSRTDELLYRLGEMSEEEFQAAKQSWGYYFAVAGKAWNRAVEAVHFYTALKRAGLPVVLRDAEAILARFTGEDLVGIVPRDVTPVYCEGMFPERFGTILDFIHVHDDDVVALGDKIEWLPEPEAKLR